MSPLSRSRRRFLHTSLAGAASLLPALRLVAQQGQPSARLAVAEAVRPRVLFEAKAALTAPVTTLIEAKAPGSSEPNTFVSELEWPSGKPVPTGAVLPFRAHATALRRMSNHVACFTAAYVLTKEAAYAQRAGLHLRAWLVEPATRMLPHGRRAGCEPGSSMGTTAGVVDLAPLAELARATSFLVDAEALTEEEFKTLNKWLADMAEWLNTDRSAGIARDSKDHRASAWLLVNAAIARSQRDDKLLEACRKRFRAPTLRNQITAEGHFPQELATADPFRNTLFNLDLLCGACQLLASPFDLLWDYELQDGPGLRAAVAFVFPSVADPTKWGFVADAEHFHDLPGPRPGLLFAGRAYSRPEYVEMWRSLDPLAIPEVIGTSFPIRQPLLWTARAAHGL